MGIRHVGRQISVARPPLPLSFGMLRATSDPSRGPSCCLWNGEAARHTPRDGKQAVADPGGAGEGSIRAMGITIHHLHTRVTTTAHTHNTTSAIRHGIGQFLHTGELPLTPFGGFGSAKRHPKPSGTKSTTANPAQENPSGEQGVLGGHKAGISALILYKLEKFNVLCVSSKHFPSAVPVLISCHISGPISSYPTAADVCFPRGCSGDILLC